LQASAALPGKLSYANSRTSSAKAGSHRAPGGAPRARHVGSLTPPVRPRTSSVSVTPRNLDTDSQDSSRCWTAPLHSARGAINTAERSARRSLQQQQQLSMGKHRLSTRDPRVAMSLLDATSDCTSDLTAHSAKGGGKRSSISGSSNLSILSGRSSAASSVYSMPVAGKIPESHLNGYMLLGGVYKRDSDTWDSHAVRSQLQQDKASVKTMTSTAPSTSSASVAATEDMPPAGFSLSEFRMPHKYQGARSTPSSRGTDSCREPSDMSSSIPGAKFHDHKGNFMYDVGATGSVNVASSIIGH